MELGILTSLLEVSMAPASPDAEENLSQLREQQTSTIAQTVTSLSEEIRAAQEEQQVMYAAALQRQQRVSEEEYVRWWRAVTDEMKFSKEELTLTTDYLAEVSTEAARVLNEKVDDFTFETALKCLEASAGARLHALEKDVMDEADLWSLGNLGDDKEAEKEQKQAQERLQAIREAVSADVDVKKDELLERKGTRRRECVETDQSAAGLEKEITAKIALDVSSSPRRRREQAKRSCGSEEGRLLQNTEARRLLRCAFYTRAPGQERCMHSNFRLLCG